MKELSKKSAKKIHEIIMSVGSRDFIDLYQSHLKTHAEMRNGLLAMSMAWYGTEIETEVKEKLKAKFKFDDLYSRNLISEDGRYIELNVLIQSLPDEIVMPYFQEPDVYKVSAEQGIDYGELVKELKSAYKGSVGDSKTGDFALLFECSVLNDRFGEMNALFGLGMLCKPYDRQTIKRLSAKQDLSPVFHTEIQKGLEVLEKGLEPDDVYIIDQVSQPYAVKSLVKALKLDISQKRRASKSTLKP